MARPDVQTDPRYTSGRLFGRLWHGWLRQHRGLMAVALAIMVIEGSTLGTLSYLLKPLFDQVFAPGGSGSVTWVGLAILGLFVLRAVTSILSKTILTLVAQRTATAMQVDLLRHLLTLEQGFFQTNPPGALIERVQGDTAAVQGIWTTLITGAGRDAIALLGLLVVAITIDPIWTLAALVGAPLLILPTIAVQRYIRRKTGAMRDEAQGRATRLDEVFHGIEAVKLNAMEDYQTARFAATVARIRRAEVKMAAGRATIPALIDVVTGLGFFLVLILAGREIAAGTRTVGDFMAFFSAMALTFQPLRRLGDLSGFWQVAATSLERLFRLFDTTPAPRAPATARMPEGPLSVAFKDVHFAYPGAGPALSGLSFTAEAGRMTAIVGPSGAGKTTVFSLLTALARPTSGRILIGGTDAATLPLDDLRAAFAVVSQNAALFDETLRENLAMGRDLAPDRLARVLAAARVADFLPALPQGLDTPAGPRGSALSGGQRQRVAIARALLRDAPILLLDEATSALDAASEAAVTEALLQIAQGRTTLVIAHRLATVRHADRIVVMEGGRAVDIGTHHDLLARGGLYADLCRLQFTT
ncbi:MAG: ABC transporter ATP-binding protein [Gemmobacter sp.]